MANTFKRLGINLLATGGTDIRVKVSLQDTSSGFLDDKIDTTNKLTKTITNPGANEVLTLDVNETNIDHDLLLNYEADEHRTQDDTQTTNTTLWSSQKTQDELDTKINQVDPVADNRILKSVGTTGVDVEQTGITVDDSDNVTGINNLTVSGDLTVNGTTTSVNTETLETTDSNITVNKDGNQASADLEAAGLTVEMSDAIDAVFGYDSNLTSRFKIGESGDLREVASVSHAQSLVNKTLDADSNTLSNFEVDNFKASAIDLDDSLSTADDTKLPTSLTVKTYVDDAVSNINASEISYDNTTGLDALNVQDAIDELLDERLEAVSSTENYIAKFDANGDLQDSTIYDQNGVISVNNPDTTFNFRVDSVNTDCALHLTNSASGDLNTDGLVLRLTNDLAQLENKESGIIRMRSGAQNIVDFESDGTIRARVTDYETLVVDDDILANKKYVDDKLAAGGLAKETGDIELTSFTATAGATDADVTGFNFNAGDVRSFKAIVSVFRDATSDLSEAYEIHGLNKGSVWVISYSSLGDASGITFNIDNTGQVTYSDISTPAGHNSTEIQFRAFVTGV